MKFVKYLILGTGILILLFILRSLIFPSLDSSMASLMHKNIRSGSEFKTKEECENNKGDWAKAGLFPQEFCRIPMSDVGKKCIAGFQCSAGTCISGYRFRDNPVLTVGVCPKYVQTFGCTQEVHFGFTSRAICRD
jgi:hypothetical protein